MWSVTGRNKKKKNYLMQQSAQKSSNRGTTSAETFVCLPLSRFFILPPSNQNGPHLLILFLPSVWTPHCALTTSAWPLLPCHDMQYSQINQVYTPALPSFTSKKLETFTANWSQRETPLGERGSSLNRSAEQDLMFAQKYYWHYWSNLLQWIAVFFT